MKRLNLLIALTILEKETIKPEDLIIVSTLITDDFSLKLISGETTEDLEMAKTENESSIFKLIQEAISKIPNKNNQKNS